MFGIDRVSSECISLTLRYLTWLVDGLVDLCCSQVGLVPLAILVKKNFLRVGEITAAELDSRMLLGGGMTHQQSCDLGPLREGNPYSRVGHPSGSVAE